MIKFGTGGWRAVIGEEFTKENILRVALGIATLAKEENKTQKPIVIGYDRRFLSDTAAKWVASALVSEGIKVLFMNRSAPTPLVMHIVKNRDLNYGIEITASHNPSIYNGIKLIVREGRDAPIETTEHLEKIIERLDTDKIHSINFDSAADSGMIEYMKNPFNDYIDDILSMLDLDSIRQAGIRLLFDPMHGSGTYPMLTILYTTRCTPDIINNNKDAYFGGEMPAPTEQGLTELTRRVVKEGYDLGISLDGDGDRLGIIDSNGRYITSNEILSMLYYYLHEYKGLKGAVVRNVATTHMLDKIAESFGEECYEVSVGFKHISSKLDSTNALLGGESSGGLTVRGHLFGKDSIYAASLFVEMVAVTGMSPTAFMDILYKKYGQFRMVEDNISFDENDKPRILKLIMEDKMLPVFGKKIKKTNYSDGCKVYFEDDSFVICRFSGTEPLLRIFAEAKDEKTAKEYIDAFNIFLSTK